MVVKLLSVSQQKSSLLSQNKNRFSGVLKKRRGSAQNFPVAIRQ